MTLSEALKNIYFYLSVIGFLTMIGLMIFIMRRARSSPTIAWLQIFLLGATLTTINQIGLFFTNTSAKYNLVNDVVPLYVVILGISFVYFGYNFIGKPENLRRLKVSLVLWGSAAGLLFLGWHTNLLLNNDYDKTILKPWGYIDLVQAKYDILLIIWLQLCFMIPFIMIIRFYFQQSSRLRKQQTKLVIFGLGIPFVSGIVSLGILPLFNIQLPPVTNVTNIVLGVVVSYALIHYGSSSLDPAAITTNIVQTMNNAAIGLNEELRIIFANKAADEFLGYSEGGLIGHSIKPFLTPGTWHEFSKLREHISDIYHDHRTFDSTVAHHTGKRLAVNIYSSMYYDKDGRWRGAVLILADIHRLHELLDQSESLGLQLIQEKKGVEAKIAQRTEQLDIEQARLQASVNSLRQGFMIVDNDLNISLINRAAHKLFAHSIDKDMVLAQIDDQFGDNLDLQQSVRKVHSSHSSRHFKDVSFGARFLNVYISPVLSSEKIIGCVLLFDDVTEQRIIERSKDEFFSIASHELRTPLTAIKGNTSMIMNYYKTILKDKDLKEMIVDVHDSSVRLIDVVNDFLDVSRLEQGKMNYKYEAINLESVIEEVAYEMQPILKDKNIHLKLDKLTLDKLPKVWVDKNRLKQVVYNLLGNAVKFTEKGSIAINADSQKNFVHVRVSDTGHGMTIESQQLLFHKFQQASSSLLTRDATRGTGLGLYICKMILENMGGAIELESSIADKGTTFIFKVPIATPERQAATKTEETITDTATGLSSVQS